MSRYPTCAAFLLLAVVTFSPQSQAQVERYYRCVFQDGTQTVRERPRGAWNWTHPVTLDEEVLVSLYGGEASLRFKTFTIPAEIVAGGIDDPFTNELMLRGGETFTALQTIKYTHVTLLLSDGPQGITAAFSYTSQSNASESLTLATGACEEVY